MLNIFGILHFLKCTLDQDMQITINLCDKVVTTYHSHQNIQKQMGFSVKYLQNICTKVSVTYLQHIGIWPHNISVTDI